MTRPLLAALALTLLSLPPAWGDEKPRPSVRCLAFSPDGKTLAAGLVDGEKGELLLREAATQAAVKWRQPQPAGVRALASFPDGKTIAAAVGPSLLLVDRPRGKTTKTLGKHDKPITAPGADGGRQDAGERRRGRGDQALGHLQGRGDQVAPPGERRSIRCRSRPTASGCCVRPGSEAALWDVKSGKKLAAFAHDNFHVSCATFLPDGKEVMTGGYDGTPACGTRVTPTSKMLLQGMGGLRGLCFEPQTKTLALWDSSFRRPDRLRPPPRRRHVEADRRPDRPSSTRTTSTGASRRSRPW